MTTTEDTTTIDTTTELLETTDDIDGSGSNNYTTPQPGKEFNDLNKTGDFGKPEKSWFANLEESTLIMIGGIAALVIVVLVVIVIVVIYIRCRSRGRRQVNIAPQQGESEAVSGDTVPLT